MKDRRLYDTISATYTSTRREDPRVAARVWAGLGDARTVLNVGAGTGNYEPLDRSVVAVEPSEAMIAKRSPSRACVVQAVAEDLPFADDAFDAAMATLTLHHWSDVRRGLDEMRRVSARQVILLFDPQYTARFWAVGYWPKSLSVPSEQDPPTPDDVATVLDVVDVQPVPVPRDCTDGFGAAFWSRPEAYLDPDVQQGMSWLAQLPPDELAAGSARLEADLRSGEWERRHGHLRGLDELDAGYRLVIAG